jgi:hypothetical protein
MKSNRYRNIIIAASNILNLRKKIFDETQIIRENLLVSENTGMKFDKELLESAFEGNQVVEFNGRIKQADHVKSCYVCGNVDIHLGQEVADAKPAVLAKLLEALRDEK